MKARNFIFVLGLLLLLVRARCEAAEDEIGRLLELISAVDVELPYLIKYSVLNSDYNRETKAWDVYPDPQGVAVHYDSLFGKKLNITIAPRISKWKDGLAPYHYKEEVVVFDGGAYTQVALREGAKGSMSECRTATVGERPKGYPLHGVANLFREFTIAGTRWLWVRGDAGDPEHFCLPKLVELLGDKGVRQRINGCVSIKELEGGNIEFKLVDDQLDPAASQTFVVTPEGGLVSRVIELNQRGIGSPIKITYLVNAHRNIGGIELPESGTFLYERNNVPTHRMEMKLDTVEEVDGDSQARFSYPIAKGFSVTDTRLGITFEVGDSIENIRPMVTNGIRDLRD